MDVLSPAYAKWLRREQAPGWKRLFNVQAPYRWNLRRLRPGYMLDVGCGLGRNLSHNGGNGVGVDPNLECVEAARAAGLQAYAPDDLKVPEGTFDSILIAHVLEHLDADAAVELTGRYLSLLKPGGRVILITPQEKGYQLDPTHVRFTDFEALRDITRRLGLQPERELSFPFPRSVGKWFPFNEFVLIARVAQ